MVDRQQFFDVSDSVRCTDGINVIVNTCGANFVLVFSVCKNC